LKVYPNSGVSDALKEIQMAKDFSGHSAVFAELSKCIFEVGAYKAVKYISPKLTVKATRKRFNGKIDKRNRIAEILFTIGSPNYAEREFIKAALKAKESFPIKRIQTKFLKD